MAWINGQAFFERCLRNGVLNLIHLKVATERMNLVAIERGHPVVRTEDIDEAIRATQELLKTGQHHT